MLHTAILGLEHFWEFFVIGAMGGASVELMKLYEYRGKLTTCRFQKLLRSPLYWAAIGAMIAVSGFVAWAVNASSSSVNAWQLVLTGIAAHTIIRDVAAAKEANAPTKLGGDDEDRVTLRDLVAL